MVFVEIDVANLSLPDLLQRASAGEDVVLTANGVPQARLVSIPQPPEEKRKLGALAGLGRVPDDFDDPLPEEILASFEGR